MGAMAEEEKDRKVRVRWARWGSLLEK